MRIVRALLLLLLLLGVVLSGTAADAAEFRSVATVSELSSQDVRPRRARTRIRVTPARPLFRQCDFQLVREVSARGTYIVPRQRCWWVRG